MPGLEGKTFGRYELRRLVGRGGMADVYEGYDPHFERVVAIKVFKREDEEMLRRFIREAHLMASLRNEHLVPVYDAGQKELDAITCYYIVMPFMEGGTLRTRIRRSPLPLAEACRDLQEIASALDYIHRQGIVHRDIKSSNVLLDAEGRCYLADFGIARTDSDVTQMTTTGNVLGTVDYVAPELFEVGYKANPRSDLYSLGVLLFEIVTGQLPFSAENQIALVAMHMNKPPPSPSSITQNISPPVERVIFKALEKRPEQRYSSATALANAFCLAVTSNKDAMDVLAQKPPEVIASRSNPHQVVLPSIPPAAPKSSEVRPLPSASSLYTPPYQASPPASHLPRTGKRADISSTPSQPASRRPWLVAILALVALLLVIVSAYLLIHSSPGNNAPVNPGSETQVAKNKSTPTQSPTATPNLTATAQAIAAATATAHAHATATAIANMTATAQAQASATAGVISTATAATPVYQDVLNNPNNAATQAAQWDGINGNNTHCSFQPDGYHVKEAAGLVNLFGCQETGNPYKNATIAVDMRIISGHSGGLFFRLSTDVLNNFSGYLFEVDSQGNYKLSMMSGGNPTPLPGHDWTQTPALKQGYNVMNTLQVIMRGDTFLFYANGTFLASVTDSTFSSEGTLGFLATAQGSNANIVYSNLKVYPHA